MAAFRPSIISRQGFSLVEVLIALTVMAVGILALVSSIGVLHTSRNTAADEGRVRALVQTISERLASLPWDSLGSSGSTAPWSQGRYAGLQAGYVETDLLAQGLLTQPTPVRNLRVFIEYYRALRIPDTPAPTAPVVAGAGLMDGSAAGGAYAAPGDSMAALRSSTARNNARLQFDPPTHLVRTNDPIVIRVLALWDDDGVYNDADGEGRDDDARAFEIVTARKR